MSRHPAPEELLLDYAAGTLPEGPALAVALHVALDPASRRTVDTLSAIGGDRKSTRLNSSHSQQSRMPSSA